MKKKTNKKLVLNKKKISELSSGEMGNAQGGKPRTWRIDCTPYTVGWDCYKTELFTICVC